MTQDHSRHLLATSALFGSRRGCLRPSPGFRILVGGGQGGLRHSVSRFKPIGTSSPTADQTGASGVSRSVAYDPDEGLRIHFLAADPGLVAAMHEAAGEENGPGDLLNS